MSTSGNKTQKANTARFSGFGELYDDCRPLPPKILSSILLPYVGLKIANLVIDLGCGTGLSTRYWIDKSASVIGIDSNAQMLKIAREKTESSKVQYFKRYSHETKLPNLSADVVTCCNSFHWMQPDKTLVEVSRLLRDGGIFAVSDNFFPPSTGCWEIEAAYTDCIKDALQFEQEQMVTQIKNWGKQLHAERMRSSNLFRHVKEITVHNTDTGSAERLTNILLSQGVINSVLRRGMNRDILGIDNIRKEAERQFNSGKQRWYWSTRIVIGIK